MDSDNADLPHVSLWRWLLRLVILLLQLAPILRYIDSIRLSVLNRLAMRRAHRADTPEERRHYVELSRSYFVLMIYEDSDATLLRLFEGFMESAPQLVLQLYILLADKKVVRGEVETIEMNFTGDGQILSVTLIVLSIVSSLVSLAWSLVVYHRSLR